MQISFSGLNNVSIYKSTSPKITSVTYRDISGETGKANMYSDFVKLNCDLSDDEKGNDLSAYFEQLKKSRVEYFSNFVNLSKPENVEVIMEKSIVKTDDGRISVPVYSFKLNGFALPLIEREMLPIYTFLARITRIISKDKQYSEDKRFFAERLNYHIANNAMEYIENSY